MDFEFKARDGACNGLKWQNELDQESEGEEMGDQTLKELQRNSRHACATYTLVDSMRRFDKVPDGNLNRIARRAAIRLQIAKRELQDYTNANGIADDE